MPYDDFRENLAWAAGFFDGEGCTTFHNSARQKFYPRLRLGQSGDGGNLVLEKFQNAVGIGKVYGPYKVAKNQRKVRWIYSVAGFVRVQAIIAMLWPWLSQEKRQQAISVLERSE